MNMIGVMPGAANYNNDYGRGLRTTATTEGGKEMVFVWPQLKMGDIKRVFVWPQLKRGDMERVFVWVQSNRGDLEWVFV